MLYLICCVNFPPSIPEIGPEVDGIHIAFLRWLQPSEMPYMLQFTSGAKVQ